MWLCEHFTFICHIPGVQLPFSPLPMPKQIFAQPLLPLMLPMLPPRCHRRSHRCWCCRCSLCFRPLNLILCLNGITFLIRRRDISHIGAPTILHFAIIWTKLDYNFYAVEMKIVCHLAVHTFFPSASIDWMPSKMHTQLDTAMLFIHHQYCEIEQRSAAVETFSPRYCIAIGADDDDD